MQDPSDETPFIKPVKSDDLAGRGIIDQDMALFRDLLLEMGPEDLMQMMHAVGGVLQALEQNVPQMFDDYNEDAETSTEPEEAREVAFEESEEDSDEEGIRLGIAEPDEEGAIPMVTVSLRADELFILLRGMQYAYNHIVCAYNDSLDDQEG